jgi:hypothetical protein
MAGITAINFRTTERITAEIIQKSRARKSSRSRKQKNEQQTVSM